MIRTQEEIQRQIDGLKIDRKNLPEHSLFGHSNWEAIDAQIEILSGRAKADDYDSDEYVDPTDDDPDYVYASALQAEDWLKGVYTDDLFDEQSGG